MDREVTIYQCSFQAYIQSASVLIKFPCTYFLEWKTANNKSCVEGKAQPSASNSHISFQQMLTMNTELIYDNSTKKFVKKETLLNLNLISKSRQNQVKLVGRVTIDLAEIANNNTFQQLKTYRLSYCSVDGEMTFSAVMKSNKLTNLTPHDLDTSSYNQYLSFCSFPTMKEPKRDAMADYDQETSLQFAGRKTTQNAIDLFPQNQRTNRHFNQTFFIMPSSPRQNSFNRTSQLPKLTRQKSLQAQTVYSVTRPEQLRRQTANGKQLNATSVNSKEGQLIKEKDKVRSRDEIDGNRQKIDELQRKIIELCANLQDSKRQVQLTERQNKEKEELIRKLKTHSIDHPKAEEQLLDIQIKYDKLLQQFKQHQKRSRATEEALQKEITLANTGNEHLRRQTEQLRKIWLEKKEYYEQKLKHLEYLIKEKESKLNQNLNKIEELTKFKYQYELIKQLNDEKESKIKMVQKDLLKMSKELEELKRNNLGEENLKLKINCSQSAKNIEQLGQRYAKCEQQVSRYKQNYIKISTAYEIQSKNYESNKEKYTIMESKYYEIQKENIELKNTFSNLKQQYQQSVTAFEEATSNAKQYKSILQEDKRKLQELQQEVDSSNQEKNTLRNMVEKLKVQNQIRGSEYQNELKRVQATFMATLQAKEKSYNVEKKQLEQTISKANQLQTSRDLQHKQQYEQLLTQRQSLKQDLIVKTDELKKQLTTVLRLNEVITDKQQIIKLSKEEIQGLKETNKELAESISRMKEKQKQMNQTIIVLEEESQKILQALEQKQQLDRELEQTKHLYQIQKQKNQALTDSLTRSTEVGGELQLKMNQLHFQIEELQALLSLKADQLISKENQLQSICFKLQEEQLTFQKYKSEAGDSLQEVEKLKQIIRQINQRYEEHLRVEEKYADELNNVRQEKEEIEAVLNNQINQVVGHNHELQNRIGMIEHDYQRLEQSFRALEEEKRQAQELYNQSHKSFMQINAKYQQTQAKAINLTQQNEKLNLNQAQKDTQRQSLQFKLQSSYQQIQILSSKLSELEKTIANQAEALAQGKNKKQELQRVIVEQGNNTAFEQTIAQLQNQVVELREQLNNQQQPYNQQITYKVNTVHEEHPISNRQTQLQQMLFESDSKNENLTNKVNDLMAEIEELQKVKQSSDPADVLYSTFPEFQREEMNKIIEEQRQEIQFLEAQLKKQTDSGALEQRIAELQSHIIELQTSFKLQLQRAIAEQTHKDEGTGTLAVITEENSEDQILYRSERSLVNSLSRIKSSFDGLELVQLKEKFHGLQEEKNRLQEQFNLMQEEKFNLLSTINEKDILIEDLNHQKDSLLLEIQDLQTINSNFNSRMRQLHSQIEALRGQLTFGSHFGFPNQQSVTRSEPFIVGESRIAHNKDIQIENLMVEIQKQKTREEELLWNIKDLEMQLQTVTENLNALNASSMNSVLISAQRAALEEDRQKEGRTLESEGYSKERLLQNLKKNQELKQLSHNLIRALKQRQKDSKQQEQLFRDLRGNQQILHDQYSQQSWIAIRTIKAKISSLIKEFQIMKLYLIRAGVTKLSQAGNQVNNKEADIIKNLLAIQQALAEIKMLSERELGQIS